MAQKYRDLVFPFSSWCLPLMHHSATANLNQIMLGVHWNRLFNWVLFQL